MKKIGDLLIEEEDGRRPICPYCEKEIDEIQYFDQKSGFHLNIMRLFVCPHCLKVLGASDSGIQ